MRRFVVIGLSGLLVGGCGILGLDTETRIGVLFDGSLEFAVVVPDSVILGESFTVVVVTVGSSSCTRIESTRVDIRGNEATITPYDTYKTRGDCTADEHWFRHEATIRFMERGEATIFVRIRRGWADPGPAVVSRSVQVY